MKQKQEWSFLHLFGGEAEGETEQGSVHTPQTAQTGETEHSTPAAGEQESPMGREETFRALMEGEYKDLFTAYFQETFNRRFREQKEMKAELERHRTLVQAASAHFGVAEDGLLEAIRAEQEKTPAPTASACQSPHSHSTHDEEKRLQDVAAQAALAAEQRLLATIRARGLRPAEGGISPLHGAAGGTGGKLSRAQRAALARRAAEGERIKL